jgi:hypothetical protein
MAAANGGEKRNVEIIGYENDIIMKWPSMKQSRQLSEGVSLL